MFIWLNCHSCILWVVALGMCFGLTYAADFHDISRIWIVSISVSSSVTVSHIRVFWAIGFRKSVALGRRDQAKL
ncbi:hypothetical protein F4604DRAFT_1810593, partial [Suillus subluteus]